MGTRKSGFTLDLGQSKKPKPVKMPSLPKPRLTTGSPKFRRARRDISGGVKLFRGRRRSGLGSLILLLINLAVIGHFVH